MASFVCCFIVIPVIVFATFMGFCPWEHDYKILIGILLGIAAGGLTYMWIKGTAAAEFLFDLSDNLGDFDGGGGGDGGGD